MFYQHNSNLLSDKNYVSLFNQMDKCFLFWTFLPFIRQDLHKRQKIARILFIIFMCSVSTVSAVKHIISIMLTNDNKYFYYTGDVSVMCGKGQFVFLFVSLITMILFIVSTIQVNLHYFNGSQICLQSVKFFNEPSKEKEVDAQIKKKLYRTFKITIMVANLEAFFVCFIYFIMHQSYLQYPYPLILLMIFPLIDDLIAAYLGLQFFGTKPMIFANCCYYYKLKFEHIENKIKKINQRLMAQGIGTDRSCDLVLNLINTYKKTANEIKKSNEFWSLHMGVVFAGGTVIYLLPLYIVSFVELTIVVVTAFVTFIVISFIHSVCIPGIACYFLYYQVIQFFYINLMAKTI